MPRDTEGWTQGLPGCPPLLNNAYPRWPRRRNHDWRVVDVVVSGSEDDDAVTLLVDTEREAAPKIGVPGCIGGGGGGRTKNWIVLCCVQHTESWMVLRSVEIMLLSHPPNPPTALTNARTNVTTSTHVMQLMTRRETC